MNNKSLTLRSSQSCLVGLTGPIFREGLNQEIIARPIRSTAGAIFYFYFIFGYSFYKGARNDHNETMECTCTEYFLAVRGFSQTFSRNAGKCRFNIPLTFREFRGFSLKYWSRGLRMEDCQIANLLRTTE